MYTRVTARLRMLGSALNDRCQTPVLVVEEVYNKSLIDWVSGQYGEILHTSRVQYLAILTTNPVNKIYIIIT